MTKKEKLGYFRSKGLLPFQTEFAVDFTDSTEGSYWLLVSPVGTGKTHLGACLAAFELKMDLNKAILVICPAALLLQWKYVLQEVFSKNDLAVSPLIVDRKTYLELEAQVPVGQSPWNVPSVIIMSIDLAKREDMLLRLREVTWDLVVFDESHLLSGGKRRRLFDEFIKLGVARRGLLLSAVPHFLNGVVTKSVGWDILDWDGQLVFPPFEKRVQWIDFQRTDRERSFFQELQNFARLLRESFVYGKFLETNIIRIASSSVYAVEGTLRKLLMGWSLLRNKIAHDVPWTKEELETIQGDILVGSEESTVAEEMPDGLTIRPEEFASLHSRLKTLLDKTEEISVDSKLAALISYVGKFFHEEKKSHLLIWCVFASTREYLKTGLQELGQPVYSITGALPIAEREKAIRSFRQNGGIFITTEVASEGVTFEYANEGINYDLPTNKLAFEQRWGRFIRFGRKTNFGMLFLRDQSETLEYENTLLRTLADTSQVE
jgi:superfamily II DNA or RNA helicase